MSEQEEYDEIIRQKFAEKEFLFNEENWEKAEKILDSSKRSRKIFFWSSIFIIGLLSGIAFMFFMNKEKESSGNRAINSVNPLNMKQNDPSVSGQKNTHDKMPEQGPVNRDSQLNTDQSAKQGLDNREKDLTAKTTDPLPIDTHEKNDLKNQATRSDNTFSHHSLTSSSIHKQKTKTGNETGSGSGSPDLSEAGSDENLAGTDNKSVINGSKATKRKSRNNKKTALANSNELQSKGSQQDLVASNKTKKTGQVQSDKKGAEVNATTLRKKDSQKSGSLKKAEFATDSSSTIEIKDTTEFQEEHQNELVVADSLSDSVKQEVKKLAVADSIPPKADSVLPASKSPEPLAMDGLGAITFVTIDAGINAQLGWQYSNTVEGRGITPVAGLGIMHSFNQKWAVYAGIQYGSIAYLNASSKKLRSTTYGFGSFTIETIAKPGILNYLVIPLTVHYFINEKNAVFAGFTGSFLIPKKYHVELRSTYVAPGYSSSEASVEKTTDDYYKTAFNHLDASICAGYRRKISSHFSITAVANFGLMDIKKNVFFSQNKFERNSSLKLLLSYTIFDF